MVALLKQSTAVTIKFGPFVDSTDGVTAETGLTISQADIRLSKNGGNIAQSNNAAGATHDELGYYDVPLDTTDTNTLGILRVAVSESGALPVWQDFMVVAANIYDSLIGGGDVLDVSVTQLAGVAQSLTDLKDFADDGYDPATNKVQGVVLTDTVTTYTGNTVQTGDSFARLGAPAGASVSADVAGVKSDTAAILVDTGTTLDARIPAALVGGRMDASVGAMAANVLTATAINADAITAAKVAADVSSEIADQVWDEALAGHLGVGSTGEQLNAAGAAGDPWATALPGAYGAGTAGKIVGDNINAPIGTVDTVVDAIKAKTDSLTFTVAGQADANVQSINDVTITGDGQVGSEFGV